MTNLLLSCLGIAALLAVWLGRSLDRRMRVTGQKFHAEDWVLLHGNTNVWYVESVENVNGEWQYIIGIPGDSIRRTVRDSQIEHL